jgi:ribosome-binding protein aMBF1 (putative translation factor)
MEYLDLKNYASEKFVEAIRDGEIVRVLYSVAVEEDLFILRTLNSEPRQPVSQSIHMSMKKNVDDKKGSVFSDWKIGKFGNKKNNVIQDLIPNFHWEIARQRKKRNITRHKLAEMIMASESDVKMIELGELPYDDFVLINRLEQLFGINLRKFGAIASSVNLADLQKRKEQQEKEALKKVASPKPIIPNSSLMSNSEIELVDD